jgi:hypothetical protein
MNVEQSLMFRNCFVAPAKRPSGHASFGGRNEPLATNRVSKITPLALKITPLASKNYSSIFLQRGGTSKQGLALRIEPAIIPPPLVHGRCLGVVGDAAGYAQIFCGLSRCLASPPRHCRTGTFLPSPG